MAIPSTPYGADPQWGTILQQPYLNVDLGGPTRKRTLWATRQGEMASAQNDELAALAAALQAQRDQKMAELAAQAASRGGGGRGGGGGGGSASGTLLPTTPVPEANWYDQLAGYYGQQTAPPPYAPTYPSDLDPTHSAYFTGSPRAPFTTRIAQGEKGYRPGPPPGFTTKIAKGQKGYRPAPTSKFLTRLS